MHVGRRGPLEVDAHVGCPSVLLWGQKAALEDGFAPSSEVAAAMADCFVGQVAGRSFEAHFGREECEDDSTCLVRMGVIRT